MEKKSLYQRLADIKLEISQAKLKKSGMNKYSGFSYYELADNNGMSKTWCVYIHHIRQ